MLYAHDDPATTASWLADVRRSCQLLASTSASLIRTMSIVVALHGADFAAVAGSTSLVAAEFELNAYLKPNGPTAIVRLSRKEVSS